MKGAKIVTLGADRIAFHESGSGFPVLLLHSNSASAKMFHQQLDSDLASRFRLIAMDLPGHGDSSNASDPAHRYTLRGLTQSVTDILEARSIDNCVLVGSSMGGNVALEVASASNRVAGLLLLGCAPVDRKLTCFADAFHPSDDFGLVFQPELSAIEIERLGRRVLGEEHLPEYMIEDIARADGDMREIVGQAISAGEFADEVDLVARLPIPLAVVLGENDAVVNVDYLRSLSYANLWRGEVQIVKDAAHAPQLQAPEAFNRLLAEFVDEVANKSP